MDQFWIKKDITNKYYRPEIPEDVKYRKIQKLTYENKLKQLLQDDCCLCFHGTTIWNAKSILESGEITARIDREGEGEGVLNTPGKIYVSTINNLWFTVNHHADLGNYKYPAGCVFVIKPTSEEEYNSAKESNLISNVDFKKFPNILKAIITTPENIDKVKSWLQSSGIDVNPDIVKDYNDSIDYLSKINCGLEEKIL